MSLMQGLKRQLELHRALGENKGIEIWRSTFSRYPTLTLRYYISASTWEEYQKEVRVFCVNGISENATHPPGHYIRNGWEDARIVE